MAATAQAAIVVTPTSQTNDTDSLPHTYSVSTTDLINGLPSSAQAGNFSQEGAGGTGVLTNGAFPSPITRNGGGPFQFNVFATGGNTGGTSVTYTLPSVSNISMIDVYGGWQDGGRDQHSYSVFYSTAVDPLTFLLLTTVDYNPADPTGNPQVTRVSITDNAGPLATNVAALRFNFNTTENGYSGYSEIDVFGSAIPEPTSLGLIGLSALGLFVWRRRAWVQSGS